MTNTYRIRYMLEGKAVIEDTQAGNPISALSFFHRKIQKTAGPKDYAITGLSLFYNANAAGQPLMVESPYDLPKGPNPNLKEEEERANETEAFGFLATTPVKEIS